MIRKLGKKPKEDILQCPKCKSKDIVGIGLVLCYAYIIPDTMKIDQLLDEHSLYDGRDELRFRCYTCENEWG